MSVFRALLFLTILLVSKAALDASDYEKYIRFHWKGELQSHSITLKVFPYLDKLQKDGMTTFLFLYTKLENQLKVINNISISFQEEEYPVTQVNITSLSPNTQYFYTFVFTSDTSLLEKDFLEHYNTTSPQEFSFKTPNIALKPYSFTFGAASCAQTGSINPVFQNLTDENLNFFIHMGDLHYSDIDKNDTKLFYEAYYKVFNSAVQRQFFESTPIVYNWDDHDFGVNDAMGTSASKPAATEAYKKFVPYYPLKNGLPDDDSLAFPNQAPIANRDPKGYLSYQNSSEFGIFRSFIIGRCLFIIMDLRSFQSIIPGDIFGEEQKVWIENQLRFAGDNAGIRMVFMVSSVPWIDSDRGALWEDFTIEQEWLGKLVEQHLYGNQKKIMLLAGDAHMLALDDGRNNKHGGFPVVQAASLDQRPHCKGGPYSHGHSIDRGQYAVLEVIDDAADQICVKVNLKRLGTSLISYDTCHPELYPQSEDQHCPPKVMAYLAPDSNTLYVILGCVILGVIFASGVYWYKSKNKEKKGAAKQGNQKYDLATEEQDIDDLDKSSQNQKGKSQEEIYTERNSEIDFHGSI